MKSASSPLPLTQSAQAKDTCIPSSGSSSSLWVTDHLKALLGRILANGQTIRWATQKPVLQQVIAHTPRGGTAVDVGCGGGTYSIELLAPRFEQVIAADIIWHHAWLTKQRAMRKGLTGLHVVVASADQLPFKDGVADFVLCCEVLEHVTNDEQALREFSRIGKDENTRLLCSVPHPPEPFDNEEHVRDGYSPEELSSKLESAGFFVETIRHCMFIISRKVIRWCAVSRMPLPLLFFCQIEHLMSKAGVRFPNPYDTIVLARAKSASAIRTAEML